VLSKLNEHVMAKPSKKEEIRARNLFRTYLRVTLLIQSRLLERAGRRSVGGIFCSQRMFRWIATGFCICAGMWSASCAFASDPAAAPVMALAGAPGDALPDAPVPQAPVTEKGMPVAILKDQIAIWTSPVRIRTHDLIWLLPLGAATGVTLATDTDTMREVSRDRTFNKDSVNASNYLLGSEIAIPVGLYGVGLFKNNSHARETGILSGEALADGIVVQEVTKVIFRRERPLYNNAAGDFFASNVGTSGSFPSSHSMLAWALAGVVAGEYPSRWVQVGVYSLATSVSLTRVLGQEHFPSDVLVGGAAGWLIGHYVFEKHQTHHVTHRLQLKHSDGRQCRDYCSGLSAPCLECGPHHD
jgi:membrane-associated phospholipid phosphatase